MELRFEFSISKYLQEVFFLRTQFLLVLTTPPSLHSSTSPMSCVNKWNSYLNVSRHFGLALVCNQSVKCEHTSKQALRQFMFARLFSTRKRIWPVLLQNVRFLEETTTYWTELLSYLYWLLTLIISNSTTKGYIARDKENLQGFCLNFIALHVSRLDDHWII